MLLTILFLRIRTLVFNMPLFTTVPAPHILPSFRQAFPTTPTASVFTSSTANTEHSKSRSSTSVLRRTSSPKTLSRTRSNFKFPVPTVSVTVVTNPDQLSGK
ncbi:hypothetical protein Hanom_Chr09g00804751 [Helianthus anomalus]